jgi:hypothetical protein
VFFAFCRIGLKALFCSQWRICSGAVAVVWWMWKNTGLLYRPVKEYAGE